MFPVHPNEWDNPYKHHITATRVFLALACVVFAASYVLHALQFHFLLVAAGIAFGTYAALMSLHNGIDYHHYLTRWKLFGKPPAN